MAGCSSSTRGLDFQGLDDDLAVAVLKQSPKGSLGSFASASSRLSKLVRKRWELLCMCNVCMAAYLDTVIVTYNAAGYRQFASRQLYTQHAIVRVTRAAPPTGPCTAAMHHVLPQSNLMLELLLLFCRPAPSSQAPWCSKAMSPLVCCPAVVAPSAGVPTWCFSAVQQQT
jgi:hypothetical protein